MKVQVLLPSFLDGWCSEVKDVQNCSGPQYHWEVKCLCADSFHAKPTFKTSHNPISNWKTHLLMLYKTTTYFPLCKYICFKIVWNCFSRPCWREPFHNYRSLRQPVSTLLQLTLWCWVLWAFFGRESFSCRNLPRKMSHKISCDVSWCSMGWSVTHVNCTCASLPPKHTGLGMGVFHLLFWSFRFVSQPNHFIDVTHAKERTESYWIPNIFCGWLTHCRHISHMKRRRLLL